VKLGLVSYFRRRHATLCTMLPSRWILPRYTRWPITGLIQSRMRLAPARWVRPAAQNADHHDGPTHGIDNTIRNDSQLFRSNIILTMFSDPVVTAMNTIHILKDTNVCSMHPIGKQKLTPVTQAQYVCLVCFIFVKRRKTSITEEYNVLFLLKSHTCGGSAVNIVLSTTLIK
jgi:hypothetical protein